MMLCLLESNSFKEEFHKGNLVIDFRVGSQNTLFWEDEDFKLMIESSESKKEPQ
jgi:hypothetical protein